MFFSASTLPKQDTILDDLPSTPTARAKPCSDMCGENGAPFGCVQRPSHLFALLSTGLLRAPRPVYFTAVFAKAAKRGTHFSFTSREAEALGNTTGSSRKSLVLGNNHGQNAERRRLEVI